MKAALGGLIVFVLTLNAGAFAADQTAKATFAGGCFWCMQPAYDGVPGVVSTTVGYTGGHTKDPSYQEVGAGGTGHAESIEVEYDPSKVSYDKLLEVFWANVDPTDASGQFCDKGNQYRSAIFYHDQAQKQAAEKSESEAAKRLKVPGPIVTEIVPATAFYRGEEYHQSYYKKNPIRYRFYRHGCGRDRRLAEVWGAAPAGH